MSLLLPHMWLLWELVLMGQSLLVFSPSVAQCADTVLSLVAIIAPIKSAPLPALTRTRARSHSHRHARTLVRASACTRSHSQRRRAL